MDLLQPVDVWDVDLGQIVASMFGDAPHKLLQPLNSVAEGVTTDIFAIQEESV